MAGEVIWYIIAVAMVGASLGVVFSQNVVHAALFLVGSLLGVAAMYLFLSVEFLFLVQLLIYGGAVTVLIILALMLTRVPPGRQVRLDGPQRPFAFIAAVALGAILIATMVSTAWPGDDDTLTNIPLEAIGDILFDEWAIPFEIASFVLLVALIGATVLSREDRPEDEERVEGVERNV
jgi:NADH-quinone oxidoreductase subunit J